jgi:hypothetical protein
MSSVADEIANIRNAAEQYELAENSLHQGNLSITDIDHIARTLHPDYSVDFLRDVVGTWKREGKRMQRGDKRIIEECLDYAAKAEPSLHEYVGEVLYDVGDRPAAFSHYQQAVTRHRAEEARFRSMGLRARAEVEHRAANHIEEQLKLLKYGRNSELETALGLAAAFALMCSVVLFGVNYTGFVVSDFTNTIALGFAWVLLILSIVGISNIILRMRH